jgi:PKD repeat protein
MKRKILMAALFVLALVVAVFVAGAPGSALAAPDQGMLFDSPLAPPNDNFVDATVISGLPFSAYVDTTYATTEPGEPNPDCGDYWFNIGNTIWYRFTPAQSGSVTGESAWSHSMVVAVYTGDSLDALSQVACRPLDWSGVTFYAEAGISYYIQLGGINGYTTSLEFYLDATPPPEANFSFYPYKPTVSSPIYFDNNSWDPAGMEFVSYWNLGDGTTATEHNVEHQYSEVGEYTVKLTITTTDGRTASTSQQVHVGVTPPPSAWFGFHPYEPSIFDTIYFYSYAWDPVGIESYDWNMGDNTTATGSSVMHQYAADGDYTVQHSVTTHDGRTASTSQQVKVITRDMAITKFSTPQAAKAGQTRQISVGIVNKSYEDHVRVDLYRSIPATCYYGWCQNYVKIGGYPQLATIRSGNRTTEFVWNYTFTTEDASIGKVTFKAVATIVDGPQEWANPLRDALPADNEAISSPTKVNP